MYESLLRRLLGVRGSENPAEESPALYENESQTDVECSSLTPL